MEPVIDHIQIFFKDPDGIKYEIVTHANAGG